MGMKEPIIVLIVIFCVIFAFLGYQFSPAATAGIQITHNGKPVDNLEVTIYLTSESYRSPNQVSTTDGTGLVTFMVNHGDMWSGGSILYNFNYNGTGYSFSEPLTQIVEVSV
jgi:hypothetical protein